MVQAGKINEESKRTRDYSVTKTILKRIGLPAQPKPFKRTVDNAVRQLEAVLRLAVPLAVQANRNGYGLYVWPVDLAQNG